MTLDNLLTPFERRRVIEYSADGVKAVRHWYDVQHVIDRKSTRLNSSHA